MRRNPMCSSKLGGRTLPIAAAIGLGSLWPFPAFAMTADVLMNPVGVAAGDKLGTSVARAGDVNGDGYADVIVGSPFHDSPGTDKGVAYVYFGGPNPDSGAEIVLFGISSGDEFGVSVGAAGDVNGDGFDDVIVGAHKNDGAGTDAGRAYVYYGGLSMNGVFDLAMTGEAAGDGFGVSVGTAGDVNGDGYPDMIVGAHLNDSEGLDAGRAYIYFGGPGINAVADITLLGGSPDDEYGFSVGSAGDVNGDGYDDFLVGAWSGDSYGTDSGWVKLHYGGPGGLGPSTPLYGGTAGDKFGYSVAGAGDVNGDGYDDFIIGAPLQDDGGDGAGQAYVFYGGVGSDDIPDLVFTGEGIADFLGSSVGGAGDVNGDGYSDLIVGVPFNDGAALSAGRAYVFLGGPSADSVADLTLGGETEYNHLGASVGMAGDVNGDGRDDVVVGAPGNAVGGTDAGRAYVYSFYHYKVGAPVTGEQWTSGLSARVQWEGVNVADLDLSLDGGLTWDRLRSGVGGQRNNWIDVVAPGQGTDFALVRLTYRGQTPLASNSATSGLFRIVPPHEPHIGTSDLYMRPAGLGPDDWFGASVAAAGDVNGDGFDDLIVGAPLSDAGGSDAGQAYVLYGGPVGDTAPDLTFTGEAAGDGFGVSVAAAGDVNGDGYPDVIVGASGNDAGGMNAGRAYVFHCGPGGDAAPDLVLTGAAAADEFGGSVAGAGDVNGDGYDDLIVGAYRNDAGGTNAGRAYIYYGGPSPDTVVDLYLTGMTGNELGTSVAGAGDVNGDGYADVIVGAPIAAVRGQAAGAAFVYLGGPGGDEEPDLSLPGEVQNDRFGTSVGTAGDVNGDGYADLIVGAPLNDAAGGDAGSVYIYHGGPGADDVPDRILTGEAFANHFGASVATAGDVNRDGCDDVVVGAPLNDAVDNNAGRVYIFLGGLRTNNPAHVLDGTLDNGRFGSSVAGAGDVNGDGFDDVVIGVDLTGRIGGDPGWAQVHVFAPFVVKTPNGGEKWVAGRPARVRWQGRDLADLDISVDGGLGWTRVRSRVGGDLVNELDLIAPDTSGELVLVRLTYSGRPPDASNSVTSAGPFRILAPARPVAHALSHTMSGLAVEDNLGSSVAGAGDMNGDGFADVIVSVRGSDDPFPAVGRAYVFHGGPSVDGMPDLALVGEASADIFGTAVAGAGDVNGDGFADVIVGASQNDAGGSNAGRAYVYFGGLVADSTADLTLTGESANDQFGGAVGTAGDVNGDGYADVIVGARANGAMGVSSGRAYVYYGGPSADAVADLVFSGLVGDQLGVAVGTAGDFNGDGFDDVIVGAALNDAGGDAAGQAYVFFGGPGADSQADMTMTGSAAGDWFGQSVGTAGDVNGDGYADVIVGAPLNDAGGSSAGRAYVFHGGAEPDTIPDRVFTGEAPGDQFGFSVSPSGDVNADGFADVVVGAHGNDAGGSLAGRAYVFFGGLVPGAAVADAVITGEAGGDWLGNSVGAAGDVRGDGFDDVLVGAPFNDGSDSNAGRAYLYDWNRYQVVDPGEGETWNVGASESVRWLGAEPADLWLSVDGGDTWSLLEENVGGDPMSAVVITVPHQPGRFARIRVTPHDSDVDGSARSDSLFTIEASIALLNLSAELTDGGVLLSWETDPGPEDLAGYRVERAHGDNGAWLVLARSFRENSYLDASGGPGMRYRLTAINGLGDELMLGETMLAPRAALAAWPLPYRGGELTVSFRSAGGLGGGRASADVTIFDLRGRRVRTLARGDYETGFQTIAWDGRDGFGRAVSSGLYFIRATGGGVSTRIKLIVVR